MKNIISLIVLMSTFQAVGYNQFSCDNIQVLGVYETYPHTSTLPLLLTNKSMVDDGNGNVYTSIEVITSNGDTLCKASTNGPLFRLPNSISDTILYELNLEDNWNIITNYPDYEKLVIKFYNPACEIEFERHIDTVNLPYAYINNCEDLKIIGIYEIANGGNLNFALFLTNSDIDSTHWPALGYVSYQLFDENDNPLSEETNPGYNLPESSKDTFFIPLNLFQELQVNQKVLLKTTNPECEVKSTYINTSILNPKQVPLISIFPNPSNGLFQIDSNFDYTELIVTDVNGRFINFYDSVDKVIELVDHPSGIYFVNIINGKHSLVRKLIKY